MGRGLCKHLRGQLLRATISTLWSHVHCHLEFDLRSKGLPQHFVQVLDQHNICVRAGNHCAKPLMQVLGVAATTRVSLAIYNDESDVDAFVDALAEAGDLFGF